MVRLVAALGIRHAVIAFVALLGAGCSPVNVINAWAPSDTYRLTADVAYGETDRQRLDIYQPAQIGSPAPVVVFFYGGNWAQGERRDYLFVGEALASRGFVTVIADYRLYPQVRYPDFLDDSAKAVRWAFSHVAEYGGDPARIFLMGHSAGAYNAAMLAMNPAYLQAAGVEPSRIKGWIGLAGPYDFLPLNDDISKAVFGFPHTARSTQPIDYASAASPPALLITGDDDDVVSPGNSSRLSARLRDAGVPVRTIVYPHIGHRAIIGAMAAHLRSWTSTLDDVSAFVGARPTNSARNAVDSSLAQLR